MYQSKIQQLLIMISREKADPGTLFYGGRRIIGKTCKRGII